MQELEIFKNEQFGNIRALTIDNEPYLVGKDVAEALGYSNINKAIQMHVDDEDKKVLDFKGFSQNGTTSKLWSGKDFSNKIIINESGFYSLVMSSKLPTAKKFKHWVTSEVLPTIRKTGTYTKPVDNRPTEVILSEALLIAKDTMEKQTQAIAELEDRNGRLDRKIEEDAPKVEQFERFINSKGLYTLRDTAKLLNYPPNALNNLLIENGYLFRTGHKGKLSAYQSRLRQGIFKLKTFEYGDGLTSHQVMVTPKGVSKINSLITEMENIEDEQYALEFGESEEVIR